MRAAGAAMILVTAAGAARAHSTIPAPATFTNPPRLLSTPLDGGDRAYDPYAFPVADGSFDVAWEDGDTDPTAHHFFYYLDHAPPLALAIDMVAQVATPMPESVNGFWASCTCVEDMPSPCPEAGVRDCRNGFTWDTHALAPGAYWLLALTRDPPYDVYTVSDGPVRIAHGGAPPPAAIVVRPDGFGTFDTSYRVRWLLGGTAPFHVDLAYDSDDGIRQGAAFTPLGADVPLVAGADGTFAFDWDLSALPSARIYHVRATVRDASGQTTYTDSRAGVTVFHPGDDPDLALPPRDLGKPAGGDPGCAVVPRTAPLLPPLLLALLLLVGIALVAARRGR